MKIMRESDQYSGVEYYNVKQILVHMNTNKPNSIFRYIRESINPIIHIQYYFCDYSNLA